MILVDIAQSKQPLRPYLHVENPVRYPWSSIIAILARELCLRIDSLERWLQETLQPTQTLNSSIKGKENPAQKLGEFFETKFYRMSCGQVVLDTAEGRKLSHSMRALKPLDEVGLIRTVRFWQERGFLSSQN